MLRRRALAAGHFELNDWQAIPVTPHKSLTQSYAQPRKTIFHNQPKPTERVLVMNKTGRNKTKSVSTLDSNSNYDQQIAERAYYLWEQRGSVHGNDWADWFQAEIEINQTAAKD